MTLKRNQLSKKALEILNEIEKEYGVNESVVKTSQGSRQQKSSMVIPILPKKTFHAARYRALSTNDKLPFWIIMNTVLGLLAFLFLFKDISNFISETKTSSAYSIKLPEISTKINQEKLNLAKVKLQNTELELKKKEALKNILSKNKAQDYVDNLTRLFEVSQIKIIKQQISIEASQNELKDKPFEREAPKSEMTDLKLDDKDTPVSPVAAPKPDEKKSSAADIKGKVVDALAKNKPETTTAPAIQMPEKPKRVTLAIDGVQFLTMKLIMQGGYVDYLKARNALTRIIPSVNIPQEEIIVSNNKKTLEFRVLYEIPLRIGDE